MTNDFTLFHAAADEKASANAPLAERMRPKSLEGYIGQEHLLGEGRLLAMMISSGRLSSMIFWGPPGSGKTTLARVVAASVKSHFIFFSAILSGIKEIREIAADARERLAFRGEITTLFVDEIHRFSKSQQDALLPHVESGLFTMIGATTENPSFEVIAPLLSRCKVLTLKPLEENELIRILESAVSDRINGIAAKISSISPQALTAIADYASGDARVALNTLETAANISKKGIIDLNEVTEAIQNKPLLYDKGGEEHYNVISAFIKSLRGSDPDGALYWLARMLEAGEDPLFIIRRMVIMASEDIGNADPRALQIAVSALQAFQLVGMPEGRIILGQAVTYLATAPKSNASYLGINEAIAEVRRSGALPVPLHIRNAPTKLMKELDYGKGYRYSHDYPDGYARQEYLPEKLAGKTFYSPTDHGFEKSIKERLNFLKNRNDTGGDK